MRGIATLILAAAMVVGSVACAGASAYPRDVPPPWGAVDTIGPVPHGGLGPFLGPIGPQCDIMCGALNHGGARIAGNVGALSDCEPMPNGGLGPFLGPIGPQCDIMCGALNHGGARIAGNVGQLNAMPMPNGWPLDEGVMPGPAPFLFGGIGANGGVC